MIVSIICPVCKANNELNAYNMACRRCREDLSLLYSIKGYSYKYRLYSIYLLTQLKEQQGIDLAHLAQNLVKSI